MARMGEVDAPNSQMGGIIAYMESAVKVICEGAGSYTHKPRTVAIFRHDDGWARVHNEGPTDPLLWGPDGEITTGHQLKCDRCTRDDYYKEERLYPELDKARDTQRTEIDVADIATALK